MIQHFEQAVICWEMNSAPAGFPKLTDKIFYGIVRADQPPRISGGGNIDGGFFKRKGLISPAGSQAFPMGFHAAVFLQHIPLPQAGKA